MKNTMKTIAKNEVFESLAHFLFLRHAYTNEDYEYMDTLRFCIKVFLLASIVSIIAILAFIGFVDWWFLVIA